MIFARIGSTSEFRELLEGLILSETIEYRLGLDGDKLTGGFVNDHELAAIKEYFTGLEVALLCQTGQVPRGRGSAEAGVLSVALNGQIVRLNDWRFG